VTTTAGSLSHSQNFPAEILEITASWIRSYAVYRANRERSPRWQIEVSNA